jgi:putative transposase
MRKAQMRLRLRIRNLVDEFHKKLALWLVSNFELVLLPEYDSSNMVNKATRKISRPSVRAMLTWAPYRFKQRLLMKSKLGDERCRVVIVKEPYTTKTCGECGHLNREVGANKVFDCPYCLTTLPRDWNAARNVFLRFVATSTWATRLPGLSLGSMVS